MVVFFRGIRPPYVVREGMRVIDPAIQGHRKGCEASYHRVTNYTVEMNLNAPGPMPLEGLMGVGFGDRASWPRRKGGNMIDDDTLEFEEYFSANMNRIREDFKVGAFPTSDDIKLSHCKTWEAAQAALLKALDAENAEVSANGGKK